jgi:aspartyl-tRNA(Asn)/glutamyl-tRNA(Gln) amidotransferase subunit B
LNCELNRESKFDRKNYFYPDIPKGYQISQYDQPLCFKGYLEINGQEAAAKKIGITRIHLEEDTGKLLHPKGTDYSLVDFNRAGVPLMELVTEPDIENGKEARLFCQKIQQIFRYLEISDADMEKGQMRCEVNISLYKEGEERLSGTKVEVKNINSFKFVEKAIDYEIKRQTEILEKGGKIIQETRGYDSNRDLTFSQRKKESAHDYRYFPEPDIPPMNFSEEHIENIRKSFPELPEQKEKRFIEEYGMSKENAVVITGDKHLAAYFEEVASEIKEKLNCGEFGIDEGRCLRLAGNYIVSEMQKHLIKSKTDIRNVKISPENYAELVAIVATGKINSSAAQTVLEEMYQNGGDPSQIIEEKGLVQLDDKAELEKIVKGVIEKNKKSAEDYRSGKENALQFLIGQIMAETKGKANPEFAKEILKEKLKTT